MAVSSGLKVLGDFKNAYRYLQALKAQQAFEVLDEMGRRGVEALRSATPVDTGTTANSWGYQIVRDGEEIRIEWTNDNIVDGWFPVAIMLQYGHGTRNGGYVQGYDYINPAIRPVFDNIADVVWKVMTSL